MTEVILEIRPGTGGEEAALFAAELFRMYRRYSERKGWKFEVGSMTPTELGGLREGIAIVKGPGTTEALRYESGVHRIQRIPTTEKSGRTHTSTATVAVLPKPKPQELEIRPQDVRIDVYRASGPGGQYVNRRESAVRITHLATGLTVTSQESRTQIQNKEIAMEVLRARLFENQQREAVARVGDERRRQIGTAERAEKIRTYNLAQDRLTDHRAKKTWHHLERILAGDLDRLINDLQKALHPKPELR
ncbi:PCRF domain-containing protein [Candidatus Parcubacteria bacterium]|nr:PCRF domain-containing protein [Candidatus Parcubacteria bacterium]